MSMLLFKQHKQLMNMTFSTANTLRNCDSNTLETFINFAVSSAQLIWLDKWCSKNADCYQHLSIWWFMF